ncbi:MAG TPA: hypothetical protein PKH65_00015 [Bacteroidia bacterium]|nr:hypothetical protein [Bacteroidia bacterium]HNT79038.1 hypothetical protein [Bacteroidia bacterium]
MDVLNKTIKRLSEEEYQELLQEVSGKKKNKPFVVLETARNSEVSDNEMMEILQVNPSTYYTLKSRMNNKIASILSKNVNNPISALMEEVARVPANLFGTNKTFSIRALKELEKQLLEYDLSSELIVVYKTLAQLHTFSPDYKYYLNLYNRHVAYSLAVSKAEVQLITFFSKLGTYLLTRQQSDLEEVILLKRELQNISELYESHRLFVIYNIASTYYLCALPQKRSSLKAKELEIEEIINTIDSTFEKYNLDTFYQNLKPVTDCLFFEYYQRSGNQVRADHYLQKIILQLEELSSKHANNFFLSQFMHSRIEKYMHDGDAERLFLLSKLFADNCLIDKDELYHYVSQRWFKATASFYSRDYAQAAKVINDLRNDVSFKACLFTELELKLFQSLQYCAIGEDGLCNQLISSIKRQMRGSDFNLEAINIFIKLLKTAMKPSDYRKKIQKINNLYLEFTAANENSDTPILASIRLDETILRKMANPLKEDS